MYVPACHPKLLRPLTLYELQVKTMEMKTNRKYLQVPKRLNSIGFYIITNALQLSRTKEKFMVVRKRAYNF